VILALDGLRLVDLTENLAGPFCAMLLADMGMDVIKIERPDGGDNQRGQGPFLNGFPLPFTMVNRNKRSVTVNLKHPAGREIVSRLAARSDVLLESYRPGVLEELGLGYEALRGCNPRLIYASISGFGQTGPYRSRGGFDLIAQAMSGLMSVTGEPGRAPVKAGYPVTDLGAGMFCAYGILTALIAREYTGEGQRVDTSLFETGLAWSVWQAAKYLGTGEVPGPLGSAHPLSAPYQAFRTADGYIVVGAGSQALFCRLCTVLGCRELSDDPRFATQSDRIAHAVELAALLAEVFHTRSTADWLDVLTAAGIPCGPVYTVAEALSDPHTLTRGMLFTYEHPTAGRLTGIGNPVNLSATPWAFRRPAPTLGEHTDAVLRELGYAPDDIARLREQGAV